MVLPSQLPTEHHRHAFPFWRRIRSWLPGGKPRRNLNHDNCIVNSGVVTDFELYDPPVEKSERRPQPREYGFSERMRELIADDDGYRRTPVPQKEADDATVRIAAPVPIRPARNTTSALVAEGSSDRFSPASWTKRVIPPARKKTISLLTVAIRRAEAATEESEVSSMSEKGEEVAVEHDEGCDRRQVQVQTVIRNAVFVTAPSQQAEVGSLHLPSVFESWSEDEG